VKTGAACAAALLLALSAAVVAQAPPSDATPAQARASSPGAALIDAVVESVDRNRGVVTLQHGEIVHLGMAPMTMAFNVADKKMLGDVKAGDKVRFSVETVKGSPTVTRIEAVH
jgi:Cu/Ag efflux protein CusF